MDKKLKNVKISKHHHDLLKSYCDRTGQKMYRVLEKFIEEHCKPKKKDLYGED